MSPDDDLLQRVHQEAGRRIRRRQRLVIGVTAVVVLLGASAAAAGVATREDTSKVVTTSPDTTTTVAATTTEVEGTTSTTASTTTTTTAPPTTTTTAPVATTTTIPPPTDIVKVDRVGGLTATITVTVDPAHPGIMKVKVRAQDDHGSAATGAVIWDPDQVGDPWGAWADSYPTSCDDAIDDDPTTNPEPDPRAGPVDETVTMFHDYGRTDGEVHITVSTITSFCTSDVDYSWVELDIPLAG